MLFTIQSFAPPPPMLFSSPAVVVFSPAGRRFPMLLSPGPRHAFSQQAQVNTPHGPGRHQPPGRRPAPDRSAHRSLLIEALIAWSMPPWCRSPPRPLHPDGASSRRARLIPACPPPAGPPLTKSRRPPPDFAASDRSPPAPVRVQPDSARIPSDSIASVPSLLVVSFGG